MIGSITDITERKRAEEDNVAQLEELRRWYAVTINREDRVADLKNEVNQLLEQMGGPPRYAKADPDRNTKEDRA